jgi:uncharacterized protein YdiU (UPF0061 family)
VDIFFQNTFAALPKQFYQSVNPSAVAAPQLLLYNQKLATELGIAMPLEKLTQVLAGNLVLPSSKPLAMAYAGHQFGHFVPELGDGRAVLLGELVSDQFHLDVHLKGSGRNRFSRRGDGRAALGPMLREYILSEYFHALKIPTTRSLAVITTGETVQRERALPGAILTRLAKSHIRIGTFEYFAARRDLASLKILADYTLGRLFPHLKNQQDPYWDFFREASLLQAQLIARWMSIGFIHGVMNTDNMVVSGETIDFGPCAFMDHFHPMKVFSSIDHAGRYAYANQPEIAQWNLSILGFCISLLTDPQLKNTAANQEKISEVLKSFEENFQKAYLTEFSKKLGITSSEASAQPLITEFLDLMKETQMDFTLAFDSLNQEAQFLSLFKNSTPALKWRQNWISFKPDFDVLKTHNPKVIPRNHKVEQALRKAEENDLSLVLELLRVIQDPFTQPRDEFFLPPSSSEEVKQTFCGT